MNTIGDYMRAAQATAAAAGTTWYSEPEVLLCEALTNHPLLRFEQQVVVSRGGGKKAVLDFLVDGRLAVEVDGEEFHDYLPDRKRDADILREHGYPTFRVPAKQVMRDAGAVVCQIALRVSILREIDAR